MGLFKRKEKQQIEEKQIDRNEKRYIIPYSRHFKGFKIFHVVVYGNDETETNSKLLCERDISNSTFEFICFNEDTKHFQGRMCAIYIDGLKAGVIFDNEQIKQIENGQILKIHVEKKGDYRFTYFVKYAD